MGLLAERGVPVHLNAEVKRITVENGQANGIDMADGSHHRADIVVSNADTAWTYRHMVEPQHRRHWTDKKIEKGAYSMSLFVWYFGTNKQYPDVPHHMMVLGPRYEGLLKDIFERTTTWPKTSASTCIGPRHTDPAMAPAGHDAFYVLAPVPHLDSGTDWPAFAETFRLAVQRRLKKP